VRKKPRHRVKDVCLCNNGYSTEHAVVSLFPQLLLIALCGNERRGSFHCSVPRHSPACGLNLISAASDKVSAEILVWSCSSRQTIESGGGYHKNSPSGCCKTHNVCPLASSFFDRLAIIPGLRVNDSNSVWSHFTRRLLLSQLPTRALAQIVALGAGGLGLAPLLAGDLGCVFAVAGGVWVLLPLLCASAVVGGRGG